MDLIEITADQAKLFEAAGIKVRYAIYPTDLVVKATPAEVATAIAKPADAPAIVGPTRRAAKKYRQRYGKDTLVEPAPNVERVIARKCKQAGPTRNIVDAAVMVLRDHGKPMARSVLWHQVNALVGDGKPLSGVSSEITRAIDRGILVIKR